MQQEIINTTELKQRLKITARTVNKYRRLGMPCLRAPGEKTNIFYDWKLVIDWLKEGAKNGK